MSIKETKPPWADEPTPLCGAKTSAGRYIGDGPAVPANFTRYLKMRLRRALKLVNSLRIDAMHNTDADNVRCWLGPDELEQRLSYIEEALTP